MERRDPYIGEGTPPPVYQEPPRRSLVPWILVVAVVAAIAATIYFFWPRRGELPPEPVQATLPAAPAPALAEAPRHPVQGEPAEEPLPSLKESDGAVAAALSVLVGQDAFGRLFVPESLVRNIVATIDNLPRDALSQRVSPLHPVPRIPATTGKDSTLALAPANASRYALPMKLVESVPTERIAAFYRRHYPLFQQAYVELGYPNGYFNDRVVEVIDHLLATPQPVGPIRLTQPKVLYEFADPALQELSAGQKAMLRIGKDNRERVKAKLRELRAAIAKP